MAAFTSPQYGPDGRLLVPIMIFQTRRRALALALSSIPLSITTVLFAGLASPALAQLSVAEALALAGPTDEINQFFGIHGEPGGSWVAGAGLTDNPGEGVIFGVRAGSGISTPGILRRAETLSGYAQRSLLSPQVRGDQVAYVALPVGGSMGSAWLDDELLAAPGDVIGSTGLRWTTIQLVQFGPGDELYIRGSATPVGSASSPRFVIASYPAEELVLAVGEPVQGLVQPLVTIGRFTVSDSGEHWAAKVTVDLDGALPFESAIVVDGALYTFSDGTSLLAGDSPTWRNTPFGIPQAWTNFESAYVTDTGSLIYQASVGSSANVYRDRSAVHPIFQPAFSSVINDVDAHGIASITEVRGAALNLNLDAVSLDRLGAGGVDVDGDGAVDLGWSINAQTALSSSAFAGEGRLLAVKTLNGPGGAPFRAIVEAKLAQPRNVICDGEVNGFGAPARLRIVGSDEVAFSDLRLMVTGVPPVTTVLPLFSRATDFIPMAGGSSGTLCLGGAIGRSFPVPLSIPFVQHVTIPVFPNAMPQPSGPVQAMAGETWYMQVWYRDAFSGAGPSNFSDAIAIEFR